MSILDKVPAAFREPIAGSAEAIIAGVVPQYADGATVDEVMNFIIGAVRHQKRVSINKDGHPLEDGKSNTFKAVIDHVEIIERRGDKNFLLGRKARIHLKAKNAKGDLEDQSIDTEWIEFHGGRKEDEIFSIALANTIKDIAESNKGKEVFVRKGFITDVTTSQGGNAVRFCANISPSVGASNDDGGSSSSSSSSSAPLASKAEIEDFIEDLKKDKEANDLLKDLPEKQRTEIPGLVLKGLAAGNPAAYLTKTLESLDIKVSKGKLDAAIAHKDNDFELFFLIAEAAID